MAGVQTVTKRIAAAGHPEVEMIRGEGYHYFVFDDGKNFESKTFGVFRFRAYTVDEWAAFGIEFAVEFKELLAERAKMEE